MFLKMTLLASLLLAAGATWAQDQRPSRTRPDTKVNRALTELEQAHTAMRYQETWALKLKEIVEMGENAVPDLIAELDATDSEIMLRSVGFMLRAIGDKRAVPALIRALPKTLIKPSSDMGLTATDQDLFAFMKKHDLDEQDRSNHYSFGRPVREIGGALEKLTGAKHGEEQLYFIFLNGGPHQLRMKRQLFRRITERWAEWWEDNWRSHVNDNKYARVRLPADDTPPAPLFPQGPSVKMISQGSGHIAEPDASPSAKYEVFVDLDTGRRTPLPKELQALQDDPHRLDKIQAWAAREGFDLMGTYYRSAGRQEPYHVIRALGLTAWEIDTELYGSIDAAISKTEPLAIGSPASGLLMHYDPTRDAYDPKSNAAFLFVTREGSYGALFIGVEVLDTNVKLGVPVSGDQALNPVGFYKGRRFSVKLVEPAEPADPLAP
jgi:hypothetical protein